MEQVYIEASKASVRKDMRVRIPPAARSDCHSRLGEFGRAPERHRPSSQVLVEAGWPLLTVADELGLSRAAIRAWRDRGFDRVVAERRFRHPVVSRLGNLDVGPPGSHDCVATTLARAEPGAYAYLFGQYLGDGTIDRCRREVYKLRIFCDSRYPGIIARIIAAARLVVPGRVSAYKSKAAHLVVITTHWKHMRCLFPQHGPGRKHERFIAFDHWQNEIVLAHAQWFLRGLVESDGCRDLNHVKGKDYPRYSFTNASVDIRRMFTRTAELLDVHWTQMNERTVAIARRPDVAYLDSFIGPKW
jgi:hypothetical protein